MAETDTARPPQGLIAGLLEEQYLEHLPVVAAKLCETIGVSLSSIRAVIPPSVAPNFGARLGDRWPQARDPHRRPALARR
jgi:hypothetical protein